MRRTSKGVDRPHRAYDPLKEVEPERLQTIGAISLAWNWIEAAIDATLCAATELHPKMWLEFTTRINGFDGKISILKRFTPLYFDDVHPQLDPVSAAILTTIGEVGAKKSLRDAVIHVRLTEPEATTGDIPVWKGRLDEVLVSQNALDALYAWLHHLARESDEVMGLFYYRWLMMHASEPAKKRQAATDFRESLARLRGHQSKRPSLPRLPEFPDPPQEPPATEAAE